jgi:GNAT superfamily N-acetyltransferase
MTVTQPLVRAAQSSDISILSEYWYDRMALLSHQQGSMRLQANARSLWEQEAQTWLADESVRTVVSVQGGEIIGGLFVRIGSDVMGRVSSHSAKVLALVIDLHTVHQRQGIGRVLWQNVRDRLKAEGVTQVYAVAQAGDMMEMTFWSSLGARPANQWFELDI